VQGVQGVSNFFGMWFVLLVMQARESAQGTPTRKITVSNSPV
jgi:hypothetical protein